MCGEKQTRRSTGHVKPGSPPRVRGKGDVQAKVKALDRITPACAGKRTIFHLCDIIVEDHPRVCGEKKVSWYNPPAIQGSPPRVRGKVPAAQLRFARCRITPACAGKSSAGCARRGIFWDHPRVCGEKIAKRAVCPQRKGSPPRVRGKASGVLSFGACIGITPACAGKRITIQSLPVSTRDHPRVCGEKGRPLVGLTSQQGSPPRVRGKD